MKARTVDTDRADMNLHHHQAFPNVLAEDIQQNVTVLQRHILEEKIFAGFLDLRVEVLTGVVLVREAREV